MTLNVAINGYGRIGRNILRAHYEDGKKHDLRIVAVNDLGSPETNAHLTRYDTTHGRFPGEVRVEGDAMIVDVYLPVMDGPRLIAAVRSELKSRVPIIAVSAGGDPAHRAAMAAGADIFIDKPMQLRRVMDTMRAIMKLDGDK